MFSTILKDALTLRLPRPLLESYFCVSYYPYGMHPVVEKFAVKSDITLFVLCLIYTLNEL